MTRPGNQPQHLSIEYEEQRDARMRIHNQWSTAEWFEIKKRTGLNPDSEVAAAWFFKQLIGKV